MTAQELAGKLAAPGFNLVEFHLIRTEAADMLLQQAEQIEQLGRWKSTNAPRIEALEGLLAITQRQVSTSRESAQMLESERQANAILTTENESLKADAERLDLLDKTRTAYGFEGEHLGNAWSIDGPFNNVRAAIDAMKGTT